MKTSITHIAMDTHKKQHQVAWVHPDTAEMQEFTVLNKSREIERMAKKIRRQSSGEIHLCWAPVRKEERGFTESPASGEKTTDRVHRFAGYRRGLAGRIRPNR